MDAERIVILGRLIDQHGKLGREGYDRFTPGFAGAIMSKLGSDPDTFNQMCYRPSSRSSICVSELETVCVCDPDLSVPR